MSQAVKSLLGNGVQEIRFAFSQTAASSQSLRSFVATAYPQLKSVAPSSFPVLIRESSAAQPKITARFDFGVERSVSTASLASAADVEKSFVDLLNQAQSLPRSDESKGQGKLEK